MTMTASVETLSASPTVVKTLVSPGGVEASDRAGSAPVPEELVSERQPEAADRRMEPGDFVAGNGWDAEFETYSDLDLPTYVGPTTFSNTRCRRSAMPG